MRARLLPLTIAAALVVFVVGLVIAKTGALNEYSWLAYAPRDGEESVPRVVTVRELVGWAVSAAGLVLLGGAGGYVVGSRRR